MLKQSKEVFIITILLTLYAFTNLAPSITSSKNYKVANWFPENINNYLGIDVKLEKNSPVYSEILKENLVLRTYKLNDNEINLALVLANNKKSVHDPQVCYVLQGFNFLEKSKKQIAQNLNINTIKANKRNKEYSFIYWYTDLDKTFTSRVNFWESIILKKLMNKPIKSYGCIILYSDKENKKDLELFALKINQILFDKASSE